MKMRDYAAIGDIKGEMNEYDGGMFELINMFLVAFNF